eukprot:scaffold153387_cov98-Attheya_sp.AAC.1
MEHDQRQVEPHWFPLPPAAAADDYYCEWCVRGGIVWGRHVLGVGGWPNRCSTVAIIWNWNYMNRMIVSSQREAYPVCEDGV